MSLAVIGSYNRDLVFSVPNLPRPGETLAALRVAAFDGGKGSNQAVQAARAGARVTMIAALGDDAAGAGARALWAAEGIVAKVAPSAAASGQAVICVDPAGENCIVLAPGANATLAAGFVAAAVRGAAPRVVLAQRETPEAATLAGFSAAKALGAMTVLNVAPGGVVSPALLALCDLLIANEGEAAGMGAVAVPMVVTLGAAGARFGARLLPSFPVTVVDTTGAGDAFCGCLCARLAQGFSVEEGLVPALAAGALACTVAGAVPSFARLDAIEALASRAGAG